MIDYRSATGEEPEDDRPRRPTPCEDCGSRDIDVAPVIRQAFPFDPFSEEFNAQPFPMIVCAGCGIERGDLYANASLSEDAATGWEVWNGESWEYELPFTHSEPPPIKP